VGLTDRQCICHGEDFFLLKGIYDIGGKEEVISCGTTKSDGKVLKRNGKSYTKLSNHLGLLPLVLISPTDTSLINESGEERRKYLNNVLSQLDKEYLSAIIRYNALLQQRNKALKVSRNVDYDMIEVLDMQMSESAGQIYTKRELLINELTEPFQKYYSLISQDKEKVSFRYTSDLSEGSLQDLLRDNFAKDSILQHTSVGVHRDDAEMRLDNYPIRKIGSQGQQKTMLLALKLAQADLLKQRLNIAPIMLLDDIFDKLDMQRVKNLISVVSMGNFGQIFLTDSNKVRVDLLLQETSMEHKVFEVQNGEFTQL
jgi:DNA replication and repair protein RecF